MKLNTLKLTACVLLVLLGTASASSYRPARHHHDWYGDSAVTAVSGSGSAGASSIGDGSSTGRSFDLAVAGSGGDRSGILTVDIADSHTRGPSAGSGAHGYTHASAHNKYGYSHGSSGADAGGGVGVFKSGGSAIGSGHYHSSAGGPTTTARGGETSDTYLKKDRSSLDDEQLLSGARVAAGSEAFAVPGFQELSYIDDIENDAERAGNWLFMFLAPRCLFSPC